MAQMPQFRPVFQGVDPWKMLGDMQSLQQIQDQTDDRRALEEAGKLYPDDPRQLVSELYRRGRSQLAMGVEKNLFEIRTKAADAQSKQLENMQKRFAMGSSIVNAITDENSFQIGRQQIANLLGPDLAAELGDTYDPARIEVAKQWGVTEADRLARQKQGIDAYYQAVEAEHTRSKDAPGVFKDWVAAYANTMSSARNAQEWSQLRQVARNGGVPAAVLEMLPEQFSPEAPEAASSLAMSAKERADVKNAQADDARAASQFGVTSAETARHNLAMEARAGATAPVSVIDPATGQPMYVRPEQAYGMRPGSTREQGRPVTSTDAGTLAELQSSLDDLQVTREQLSGAKAPKATGAAAQIGAALPNVVTEFTGWGTDAKQKQALIDRVRQVIGKALEGGVLRKEDEAKYTKILPTIGDTPAIVRTKLDNLEKAITAKRERMLEALDDASYDTSKYRTRQGGGVPATSTGPASPAGGNPFRR